MGEKEYRIMVVSLAEKLLAVFVLVCLILFPIKQMFSQDLDLKDIRFRHLTYRDGLGGNRVFSIIRDSRGFLWFGTENSLARFDGQTIKTYHFDINDSTSIRGNAVGALLVDRQNRVCIGTDLGLVFYDLACDRFIPIPDSGVDLKRRNVIDLDMDGKGNLLVTFLYHVMICHQGKNLMTPFIDLPSRSELFSVDDYLCQTEVSPTGEILIFTSRKLIILDSFNRVLFQQNHLCGIIHSVRRCTGDKYLIAASNGLFLFCPFRHFLQSFSDYAGVADFAKNEFWDAFEDPSGNIWTATDHNGIFVYRPQTGDVVRIVSDPFDPATLNDNFVRKFYLDNSGILWIGCYKNGINYTHLNPQKKFTIYQHIPGRRGIISSNSVVSVLKDKKGNLWIGTDGGGLNFIDYASRKITYYDNTKGIPSNAILTLMEDKAGRIWVGGYMGKISLFHPESHSWEVITPGCSFPGCNGKHDIRQILEDSQGKIWVATNGHGLLNYEPYSGKWNSYNTMNSALIDNYVLTLKETDGNQFWVGTYNGLCLLNPETKQGRSFIYSEKKRDGISHNWVYSLHLDSKKRLWIGTANGLNLFRPEDTSFIHITKVQGLPGNTINAITEDSKGNLWISTDNGICRYNYDSSTFWNLYEEDGLPGNFFLHGSYFQTDSGEIFFGSDNGLVQFLPEKIKPDTTVYPVYIRDVLLNYKSVLHKIMCSENSTSDFPAFVIPYAKTVITIQFGALNYVNQKNNRFEYRLKGYEDNWIPIGTRREVSFTNLEPGTYTFFVRGCNNDGFWDMKGDSLTIVVLTPWYRSWFFRIIVLLVLIAMMLAFVYYRNLSIIRTNKILEQEVQRRTHELEVANEELLANTEALDHTIKELEIQKSVLQQQTEELRTTNERLNELNKMNDRIFSIIAHDIKNPLGTILGFIELLTMQHTKIDEAKREEYIDYIRQSVQKLLSLIENLLLWSSSQLKGRGASPAKFNLVEPIVENIALLKEQAIKKNILVTFIPDGTYIVFADKYMVSAVVRNILSNAIKFCKPGGEVAVSLQKEGNCVVCSVSDQGEGMDEETRAFLFDSYRKKIKTGTGGETGSGLGLLICKEFIGLNRGEIWVESTQGSGTTFFFRLPIEENIERQ